MCRFTLADRMDPMIPVSLQVRMLRDVGLEPVDDASPPPPPPPPPPYFAPLMCTFCDCGHFDVPYLWETHPKFPNFGYFSMHNFVRNGVP